METAPGEITQLLGEMRDGRQEAESRLIPLVYRELRRTAANYLRKERRDHTLQPTALVNEAYLRLTHLQAIDWQSRTHFFAISATLMRRILVEHARAHQAQKRGLGWAAISFDEALFASPEQAPEVLALDEALGRLGELDARQSKIVELRFFAGMTEEEIGNVLGLSARTVKRDWRVARAWLYKELKGDEMHGS